EKLAPGLDWTEPKGKDADKADSDWARNHPTNYFVLLKDAKKKLSAKDWKGAKEPLEKLITLCPDNSGADSPYSLLARAQRQVKETELEQQTREKLAQMDSEALDAYKRLVELAEN